MMWLIEAHGNDINRLCKRVLCAVPIVYRPLTFAELTPMADLHESSAMYVRELVTLRSSYVILRKNTIRIFHQSAKEYLD